MELKQKIEEAFAYAIEQRFFKGGSNITVKKSTECAAEYAFAVQSDYKTSDGYHSIDVGGEWEIHRGKEELKGRIDDQLSNDDCALFFLPYVENFFTYKNDKEYDRIVRTCERCKEKGVGLPDWLMDKINLDKIIEEGDWTYLFENTGFEYSDAEGVTYFLLKES